MSFRPPDSPYYYAEYIDEHGDRRRVSTKSRTKREADAVEAELRVKAERVRLGLDARPEKRPKWTMEQAATWWLENIAVHQRNGKRVGYVIKAHVIRDLGALPLEQVTRGRLNGWLADKSRAMSPASCNRLRAYTMSIFSRLIERDLFTGENPVRKTKKLKQPRPVPRAMPASAVWPLINHAPAAWQLAFKIAAFTGMRRGEIAALRWRDIADGVITVRKTKSGADRRVAVHVTLAVHLAALVLASPSPDDHVIPALDWNHSSEVVRRAAKSAGLDVSASFHGFRGTWASTLIAAGADATVVEFMGWRSNTATMFVHYVAFPDAVLHREIAKLVYP